jgi:hypothetical protein
MMGNHAVFGDNYGQKGAVSEQHVNELYKAHFRRAHYKAYDEKCLKYLHGLVANVDEGVDVKREVLSSFIKTIAVNTHLPMGQRGVGCAGRCVWTPNKCALE